ncbi:MAG: hypothetical protein V3T85_02830 [Acidiferrobacterales bacterium]
MIERIRDLIERFSEDERLVCELMQSDSAFEALCQEYRESANELSRLELVGGSSASSEANWLKQRRCWLEEEILAMIEGYRPV